MTDYKFVLMRGQILMNGTLAKQEPVQIFFEPGLLDVINDELRYVVLDKEVINEKKENGKYVLRAKEVIRL